MTGQEVEWAYMLEDRTIICVASSWDYDPTSKHHLMRHLATRNNILWVNYHGTRRPRLNKVDVRAGCSVLSRFVRGLRQVGPSFYQFTPLVIPGARSRMLRTLHERLLIAQIRSALRRVAGSDSRPVQVWSFAPDVPYLAGRFGEECFLYYCVDEYREFEGLDGAGITASENELIARADLVVTTAQALYEAKRARRSDVVLVRHGVDYDHFAAAWREALPVPKDIATIPRPIFGFFGLIQFWVDRALLAEVARLRPHYSFVLIGDCAVDVSELARLPNVYLLGRRPNSELPAYCAAFTAGLMPFTRSTMTRSVNPIKMYEYLAAGLPVISTPLPEAERFAGPITLAESAEDFARGCDAALATDGPDRRRAISQVVAHESWASKVELLSEIIEQRVTESEIIEQRVTESEIIEQRVTGSPPINSLPAADLLMPPPSSLLRKSVGQPF